ncbi:Uncharacterised protein [uncultured archaeon]|nr:Uncharacterised protein [uncultured archaeon]
MSKYFNPMLEGLKRGIILEGLEVLCSGRNFLDWAEHYQNHEEVIIPGELEFVKRFRDYVLINGFSKNISNPLYDSSLVDQICSELG